MKLKKIIKEKVLTEIGEGLKPYEWKEFESEIRDPERPGVSYPSVVGIYSFKTDGNENYTVKLNDYVFSTSDDKGYIEVLFKSHHGDYSTITNEGKALKVISTVIEIVKDFHRKNKELFEKYFQGYIVSPSGKAGETGYSSQRAKIYKRFVEKQFPNWEMKYNPSKDNFKVVPK